MEIISRAEARTAGLRHYFTGKPCKRGGIAKRLVIDGQCKCDSCKVVKAEYQATYYPGWAEENKAELDSYQAEYRTANSRRRVAYNSIWKTENPERYAALQAAYRSRNPEKGAANTAMRRARLAMATPIWLTDEHHRQIALIYAERERITGISGVIHHVDHIVPLRGCGVCGLHVPWNLQVIPANDNMKKSNKVAA